MESNDKVIAMLEVLEKNEVKPVNISKDLPNKDRVTIGEFTQTFTRRALEEGWPVEVIVDTMKGLEELDADGKHMDVFFLMMALQGEDPTEIILNLLLEELRNKGGNLPPIPGLN